MRSLSQPGETWWDWQAIEASRIERCRDLREARAEVPEWERAIQVKKGYAFNSQVGDGRALSVVGLTFGVEATAVEICDGVTERLDLHVCRTSTTPGSGSAIASTHFLVFDVKSRIACRPPLGAGAYAIRVDRSTATHLDAAVAVGDDRACSRRTASACASTRS